MFFLIAIAVFVTLVVAFVNGMTDAPNAITSVVSTNTLSIKKAVVIAAVADFAGSVTIGLYNGRVAETIINIADFGGNNKKAVVALISSMIAVILWALAAWRFGIPTSESHALIAAVAGAGIGLDKGVSSINADAVSTVVWGLIVSVFSGFAGGYITARVTDRIVNKNNKSDNVFKYMQIIASAFMSFMHGAQDSQKFTGIILLAFSFVDIKYNRHTSALIHLLCPLFICAGTATGGKRIIKAIGTDMLRMRREQGFSADIAGSACLLVSTLFGMPVSTTHAKTSAIMGVGTAQSIKSVNWRVAGDMIIAWAVTFPVCGLLGFLITKLFTKLI